MSPQPDVSTTNKPEWTQDEIDMCLSGCLSRDAGLPPNYRRPRWCSPQSPTDNKAIGPVEGASSPQQSNQSKSRALDLIKPQEVNLGLPCEDFIKTYVQYADVMEAPTELHEAVAISMVGAILNSNEVTIRNGSEQLTLDIWMVLLSGSGGGRSSMVRIPGKILAEVGLAWLISRNGFGSVQAMYQHFAVAPTSLNIWGEMSEKLKELGGSRFGNGKAWLTDRYDEIRPPDDRTYRKTNRVNDEGDSTDTPDIKYKGPPRTNFLATSSVAWFFKYLTASDSMGGFIPRWMICKAKSTGRLIPTPQPMDETLLGPLASKLQEIARIEGEADLTLILPLYQQWYVKTYERFKEQANSDLALAFWNRHRGHILKLAVVYEAARSSTLKVSLAAWEQAVPKARQLEENIFGFLDTNMSHEGYELNRMEERVRQAGRPGLPKHEFTQAFKTDIYREQKLKTLIDAQTLVCYLLPSNGGRPGRVLVHPDFDDEFTAAYRAANGNKSPTREG